MSYQSLIIFDNKNGNNRNPSQSDILWNFPGPLSDDAVAGAVVAVFTILNKNENSFTIQINGHRTIRINSMSKSLDFIDNYLEYNNVTRSELIKYYAPDGYYGWWVYNPNNNTYSLYRFLTTDFVRGFISACIAFGADFRNYTAGVPFRSENFANTFYNIAGYDVEPLIKPKRDQAPIYPFYTYVYEQYDRTGNEPQRITDEIHWEYPVDYD